MKNILLITALISFTCLSASDATYSVNAKTSNVHWLGKKTTGQHEGDVKLQGGKLNFSNSVPVSGEFVLDMNSITVTDIEDAEDNAGLVKHLKNEDFFATEKNPLAVITVKKLESKKAEKPGDPNYNVIADLTIKGVKNEIQFPATILVNGSNVTATADITIDRTKWNISYKSKSILGSAADKFIHDEIYFSVKLFLEKQK